MIPRLDTYDWREAFAYAGEPGGCGSPDVRTALPNDPTPADHFAREDVADLLGAVEGANDEAPWYCYGRLRDGRFFYLEASCDYTGWDCVAGGSATVASSLSDLVQFGMTNDGRDALKVSL